MLTIGTVTFIITKTLSHQECGVNYFILENIVVINVILTNISISMLVMKKSDQKIWQLKYGKEFNNLINKCFSIIQFELIQMLNSILIKLKILLIIFDNYYN